MLSAPVIQPLVLQSNAAHPAQLPSRPTSTAAQRPSGDIMAQCTRCGLLHAPSRACPRLQTEVQIRLALDEVRIISGGNPVATNKNRDMLQQILKNQRVNRTEGAGRAVSTQPVPQPHMPVQQAPQQAERQEQPRLAAPVEDESSDSDSDSETGSDSGSNSPDDDPDGESG